MSQSMFSYTLNVKYIMMGLLQLNENKNPNLSTQFSISFVLIQTLIPRAVVLIIHFKKRKDT